MLGKMDIIAFISTVLMLIAITASPLKNLCFVGDINFSIGFLHVLFAILLSFVPMLMLESMKFMKKDDSTQTRDS